MFIWEQLRPLLAVQVILSMAGFSLLEVHCVIFGHFEEETATSVVTLTSSSQAHPNLDTSLIFLFVGLIEDTNSHPNYKTQSGGWIVHTSTRLPQKYDGAR